MKNDYHLKKKKNKYFLAKSPHDYISTGLQDHTYLPSISRVVEFAGLLNRNPLSDVRSHPGVFADTGDCEHTQCSPRQQGRLDGQLRRNWFRSVLQRGTVVTGDNEVLNIR